MSMRRWLFLFWAATACALSMGAASAQNLVMAQAFWEDETGQADFSQARTQNYTPHDGVFNQGYTTSTTWLRVRIRHLSAVGSLQRPQVVLRVQPHFLDHVRLFDPLDLSDTPRIVGDRFAYSEQEYKSISYGFVLPASEQDRDVWLQLKTTSVSKIRVDAFDEVQMRTEEQRDLILRVFCIGLIVFYLFIVLIRWVFEREWLYLSFLLRTSVLALVLLLQFGFLRVMLDSWVTPEILDLTSSFLAILLTLMSFIFELSILRDYRLKPWAKYLSAGIFSTIFLAFLFFGLGEVQHALRLNAYLIVVIGVLLLLISLFGTQDRYAQTRDATIHLHRYWLSLYYFLLCVLLFGMQSILFGWYETRSTLPLVLPYAIFSNTVLMFIIEFRVWEIRNNFYQAKLNLLHSSVREQEERIRRQEQGNLLNMLMHEIRNPLAVIEAAQHSKLELHTGIVSKNIGVIRHVLSRMLKIDQLSDDRLRIEMQSFLLSDCLVQAIDDTDIDTQRLNLSGLGEDTLLYTDRDCLRVIVVNLLGNAFKYGSPEASVELAVMHEVESNRFCLAVVNSVGPGGIPDPSQVFDKYYRGEAAKSLPGTGMGLYLVQQLTQRLGGECRCLLEGHQVRFEVWLPSNEDKSLFSEMI